MEAQESHINVHGAVAVVERWGRRQSSGMLGTITKVFYVALPLAGTNRYLRTHHYSK